MNIGLEMVAVNLGVSLENIVLLIILAGSLMFFAKDIRLGLVMLLFISAITFAFFYVQEMNYIPVLVVMFMSLIVLSFTLLGRGSSAGSGFI